MLGARRITCVLEPSYAAVARYEEKEKALLDTYNYNILMSPKCYKVKLRFKTHIGCRMSKVEDYGCVPLGKYLTESLGMHTGIVESSEGIVSQRGRGCKVDVNTHTKLNALKSAESD